VTSLAKLGYIGLAKEVTQGTYVTPSVYIPCTKIDAEDVFMEIRDESFRNNDTLLQGVYQGPGDSTVSLDLFAYPDVIGYILRGIVGPDTVTATGVSTTLASNASLGATSLSLTASVPSNSVIRIQDSGGLNTEYVQVGTVTGTGPYTAPVSSPSTGTLYAHTAAGGSVTSQSTHSFKQNPTAAQTSWSLTKYDVATNATATHSRGFPGCKISEAAIKIDPKAAVTFAVKYTGWLSAEQADPTPSFSQVIPALGWEWTQNNAGGASTRGLTYDLTLKRPADAIHASTGTQQPREVFQGVLEADGTYKAIFENDTDLNLYLNYTQLGTTATLTQPVTSGGSVMTFATSKSGYVKGKVDLSGVYVVADFSLSGIYNSTDGGAVTVTLTNYTSTAY
jgi:Phage tail tube protein